MLTDENNVVIGLIVIVIVFISICCFIDCVRMLREPYDNVS